MRKSWWIAAGAVGLLAVGLSLRLTLLRGSGWLLEGDDALSALMGLGILDGDRPIMLKNQTYAGAWEPYAMALAYAGLGISRVSAKLPELIASLATIGATWLLAREAAGRTAAWFAACLAALPPAYVMVLSLKPWAPYTEVIVFGSICLTCALRLGWPRPFQRDGAVSLVCGLAGGCAFWLHPLAIWYVGAASLSLLARVRGQRWRAVATRGLAGFALGALPVWLFNLQTGGATLRFVLSGTQGQTAERWAVLGAWWNNDLPRGAGLWHPWGPNQPALEALVGLTCAAALAWAVFGRRTLGLRPLDGVLALLVLIPTLFVLSGFGGPALNPYGFDATGRYAPPIWSGLSVVLGAALAGVWRARRWLAVVLSLVPLGVNLVGLRASDPVQAFQSPYWARLPVDNRPLLRVLDEEDVHAVWMNHWAGQPVMFDARVAGESLVAYDWYDVQAGGIDRFPEYRALVENADRAAFVLVTEEVEPALEQRLRAMGVAFVERRAPPYLVVIPTSRRVAPWEVTDALDYRY